MALECPNSKTSLHGFRKRVRGDFALATSRSEEPVIPSPEIFGFPQDGGASSPVSSFRLPDPSECAAHLELLETFFVLRQRILRSEALDSVMGTEPVRETRTGHNGDTKTFKDDKLWERRQAKWPIFVEFAVVRFLEWSKPLALAVPGGVPRSFPLPPLDVIMVWHALMLNPRLFADKFKGTAMHKAQMPWRNVRGAIDDREWTFTNSEHDTAAFEKATNLEADLFEELSTWPAGPNDAPSTSRLRAFALEGEPSSGETAGDSPAAQMYMACFGASLDRPFAVELRDAVMRQTSFVDKMHGLMWIRSPALAGTLRRGIARYDNFLGLLKQYPGTMIVPTLDIDLAWHTHQCQALQYAEATKTRVGRFVNHDDSIVKDKLSDGFAKSSKYFRIQYGREYRVCGCWDCEALLDAVEGVAGATPEEVDMGEIARSVEERVKYYRAVERARLEKSPLPKFPMQLISPRGG
jgi:hypothetical protein